MGTILIGKVESGIVSKNETILLMPNRVSTLFPNSTHVYGLRPPDKTAIKDYVSYLITKS